MIQTALVVVFVYWLCHAIDVLFSFQTFSRPIVAAPLIGLALGDLQTGIIMGASLESIFMGISAIGGSIPADPLSSSIIAVSYTILTGANMEAGLAIAMPIGTAMMALGSMFMPFKSSLAPYWENLASKGDMKKFRIQMLSFGLICDYMVSYIVLFFAIAYGIDGLQAFLGALPPWVMSGLGAASSMMIGVGLAILTSMIWSNEVGGFFFVGFVLAKYVSLPTLPIAILAAVVAIMYFYNDKKLADLKKSLSNTSINSSTEEDDFF